MTAINIAKKYFEFSNERDLSSIKKLFQANATYSSDNTGIYYGVDSIMEMMSIFYNNFGELSWTIDSAFELNSNITEINFTFNAEDIEGNKIIRQGVERIIVEDGLIRHIEVRSKS